MFDKLREAKDDRALFRRRETDVQQTYLKTQAELARKQNDLAEVRNKIKSRQENSPAVYNYLVGMSEAIRSECRALDVKVHCNYNIIDVTVSLFEMVHVYDCYQIS